MPVVVGGTISHYKILEKLGSGGMGEVYKAEDTALERPVALKFLAAHLLHDEEAKQRFLREAKSTAAINHPNICPVYEIGEESGQTFIAMAYIEGESLEDRIAKGPLALKDTLEIARQVAEGLEAAHKKSIVHRDIKPANIMVDTNGRATILDFGLARLTEASKLTGPGQTVGTAAYMSPEQIQGDAVDRRTDIWALGCVVYGMVTGVQPFKGEYAQALAYEICSQEPEPLTGLRTGVPIELELLVAKCMAKDRENRYSQTKEIATDLRTLADKLKSGRSLPVTVTQQAISARTAEEARWKQRLPWAVAALLGLALASVSFVHFIETQAPNSERLVRRFVIIPPGPLFLETDGLASGPSISPDGRYIAFTTAGDDGQLWVQDLAQRQPRPIEDTSGALQPFWSPDSEFIGFAAGAELKKVSVHGGPPVRLCGRPGEGRSHWDGATWSPDGESIVFSADHQLYEVSARGGSPGLITSLDKSAEAEGQGAFMYPHFMPESAAARSVMYVSGEGGGTITVQELQTGRRGTAGAGLFPCYSPSGHIIYQSSFYNPDLWAVPFSLETQQVSGEAFPIARNARYPSVAVDGTLVAVELPGSREERLVWRDRQGRKLGEIGKPQARILFPTLSPDGRWVAVQGREEAHTGDIWLHEVDRAVSQRLTFDPANDNFPTWSPDGEEVTFGSARQGLGDLFVRRADGSGAARPLVVSPATEGSPDWSPDGRRLIYSVSSSESGDDLVVLTRGAEGEPGEVKPFLATPFVETTPQISPNGLYVAYSSNESGAHEVYVRKFPTGEGRWLVSERGGTQPRWSPDGKELFYVERDTLMAVEVSTDRGFRTGRAERLFADPTLGGLIWDYDVSADRRFVMVQSVVAEDESRPQPVIRITENWYEDFRNRQRTP